MIDSFNADRTGWAWFSDDKRMRFRLARSLTGAALDVYSGEQVTFVDRVPRRCVFVMLNPSTADAFVPDPTVGECLKRARSYGAEVLEVVNLFALRSPYPADLRKERHGYRGDDTINDRAILAACYGADRVVAAWGNHGELDARADIVTAMLEAQGIPLMHLGLTIGGRPKHPLARGKHRIPAELQPVVWERAA